MKKLAVLFVAGSLATAASAQETIGTLQGVTGAVSISGKNFVSKAKDGAGLTDGASVLVSSTGKATIALKNGCTVSLGANQHLTVNSKLPCEQISASVKHLFPAYQVAQAPIGAGLPPPPSSGAGASGAGASGAGASGAGAAGAGAAGAGAAGAGAAGAGAAGVGAAAAGAAGVGAAGLGFGAIAGIAAGVVAVGTAVANNNNSNPVSGL